MTEQQLLLIAWSHNKGCLCDICADAKALLPEEDYDPWEENNYALQLEGRAYGPHNPECIHMSTDKPEPL